MNSVSKAGNSPIDFDILRELERDVADDDPNVMLELTEIFLEDSLKHFEGVGHALAEGDYRKMEISGHSVKSSAATFGALVLADLCRQLEMCARTRQNEGIVENLAAARLEFARVQRALLEKRIEWKKAAGDEI
jgi:HPt (histidine-containing phosphotransfer) domain-containing protein